MGNGEDTDAALRASRMADQMCATAMIGIGYGRVYDLNEGLRHLRSRKVRASREKAHPCLGTAETGTD